MAVFIFIFIALMFCDVEPHRLTLHRPMPEPRPRPASDCATMTHRSMRTCGRLSHPVFRPGKWPPMRLPHDLRETTNAAVATDPDFRTADTGKVKKNDDIMANGVRMTNNNNI